MLPEPRNKKIMLRLTPSEERALAALAAQRGVTRPTTLRELIRVADLQRQIEEVTKRPTRQSQAGRL